MENQQPLLHEVLRSILGSMTFPVSFLTAVNNNDGTYSLYGIKHIHHLQPGFKVTIGTHTFTVKDYSEGDCFWIVTLNAGDNPLPAFPGTFTLYRPFFFHGTPQQQQNEFTKIDLPDDKTPMVYVVEPYEPEYDYSADSSIDSRHKVTLCALSQVEIDQSMTDDFYHNVINPMNNLLREFVKKLIKSNLFYTDRLKVRPKYHTKFAIWIPRPVTKELIFSEKFGGVSAELYLEMYRIESCDCPIVFHTNGGDFNNDHANDFLN